MSPQGRPAETPRLNELRPRQIAIEVEQAVIDHIASLGLLLSPGVEVHSERVEEQTSTVFYVTGPTDRGQPLRGYHRLSTLPDDAEYIVPTHCASKPSRGKTTELDPKKARPLAKIGADEWADLRRLWSTADNEDAAAARYWRGPSTGIGLTIVDLVHYAQTGSTDIPSPWDEFATSLMPLHRTALEDDVDFDGVQTAGPSTALGVAMLAAEGRDRIDRGKQLEAQHIYTLASLGKARFAQLLKAGDVPAPASSTRPAVWDANQARAWLQARGVPGL